VVADQVVVLMLEVEVVLEAIVLLVMDLRQLKVVRYLQNGELSQ
tara:strand:+ start:71 stop:202 length:132 start_codon:yes stop_codon:yes gene_type:complete